MVVVVGDWERGGLSCDLLYRYQTLIFHAEARAAGWTDGSFFHLQQHGEL
jgi:hypothetical protein